MQPINATYDRPAAMSQAFFYQPAYHATQIHRPFQ
jgi:hypothetical protein